MVSYTLCLTMQIFHYCWYGNEVKLKVRPLPRLQIELRDFTRARYPRFVEPRDFKILLLITRRALEPIEFTGCHIISMNLDSFVMVSVNEMSPVKMAVHTLQCSRVLLSICGCLPPSSWTSSFAKSLYNVYTSFVWLLILSLVSAQILDIIINVENQDQFSDNFYVTLVVFVCSCKLSIMLMHRRSILSLIDRLENEPFATTNDEEVKIRSKFNKMNERTAIAYMVLVKIAVISLFARSSFTNFKKRKLTLRVWLPYDYSELLPYAFSYAFQFITSMLCSCQNVACDTLFAGLLIQIYSQFVLLDKRLRNMQKDGNYSAKQCVKHYQQIYKFVWNFPPNGLFSRVVNEKFKIIIFLQFSTIAFTLCFNLYRMSSITVVSKFLEASLYLIRIIAQILYYCWFSNEVKLKSLEVPNMIFNSNWTSWDEKTKKILLLVMTRTTRPIEFTSGYLVTLNIQSFLTVSIS
ncbi:unnamed protein product [Heterotrigona itama]|uniref:Odorant receptor n=1 Tax=Heterotrigona itama TaxID=395501 RepID=A0A6V7H5W0_9HYME|nr:unnamed protein product [Heterotrigona itama]